VIPVLELFQVFFFKAKAWGVELFVSDLDRVDEPISLREFVWANPVVHGRKFGAFDEEDKVGAEEHECGKDEEFSSNERDGNCCDHKECGGDSAREGDACVGVLVA